MGNTLSKSVAIPLGLACVAGAIMLGMIGVSMVTGKVTFGKPA